MNIFFPCVKPTPGASTATVKPITPALTLQTTIQAKASDAPSQPEQKRSTPTGDEASRASREQKSITFSSDTATTRSEESKETSNQTGSDAVNQPVHVKPNRLRGPSMRLSSAQIASLLNPVPAPPPSLPNPFTHHPGQNLHKFRYAYPVVGRKPKTASEMFGDAPPEPIDTSYNKSREYDAYAAQRSGDQSSAHAGMTPVPPPGVKGRRSARNSSSLTLQSLAKAARKHDDAEEESDDDK